MTTNPLKIGVISLFPEMFNALNYGVVGRQLRSDQVALNFFNPRKYANNQHGYIDDSPYGGGPGMIMQAPPLIKAMQAAEKTIPNAMRILVTPNGTPLTHQLVKEIADRKAIIIACGRYEGVDQRFVDAAIDLEISIGDFILSGGELAAMSLIDAVIRLQPKALGDPNSAMQDSFSDGLLEAHQYTRPKTLENRSVPSVLLCGDHAQIARWRRRQSLGLTWQRRPELLDLVELTEQDKALLEDFKAELNKGNQSE